MFHRKERFFRVVVVLGIVLTTWLIGIWLSNVPELEASQSEPPQTTFQSPIGNPQLSLRKRASLRNPKPGDIIMYTLSYSNTNPGSQGFDVRVYDFLPAGIDVFWTNPIPTYDADGVLIFSTGSVGPGTEDQEVKIQAHVLEGYEALNNQALVVAEGVRPVHASLVLSVTPPVRKLELSKSGYTAVLTDSALMYRVRCENVGDYPVNDVVLMDVLPDTVAYDTATPLPDQVTSPVLQWTVGRLEIGEVWQATVTSTTSSRLGIITNTAIVDAEQLAMTSSLFATQVISEGAILWLEKSASVPKVSVGDTLVYTLDYWNLGNRPATQVRLTDTLPSDVLVVGTSLTPTVQSATTLVWELEDVPGGAAGQVVFTTTVQGSPNRTLHNVADLGGLNSFDGHAEVDVAVRPVEIYLPVIMRNH